MAGLKLVHGGSTPSFLVSFEPVRMQVLQMCGKEGDIRAVILHL